MYSNNAADYLDVLDQSGDGTVTVEEIQLALRTMLGISIDKREKTFATFIHNYADTTGNGKVTITDIRHFMEELNEDGETTTTTTKLRVTPETDSESSDADGEFDGHIDNLIEGGDDLDHPFMYD